MALSRFVLDNNWSNIECMEITQEKSMNLDESEPRHPIQVVARRSGLSADVIRVWERRYEVVNPARGNGGRRIYSDLDIRRLQLLQKVTQAGRRISEVADLDNAALAVLVEEDNLGAMENLALIGQQTSEQYQREAFGAVKLMSQVTLQQVLGAASGSLSLPLFLEQFLSPLLKRIGTAWSAGEIRVGHEHMATEVIRHYLQGLLVRTNRSGPAIIFFTPSGQRHDLGTLMAAVVAASEGWQVTYLGPDIPASDILAVVEQVEPKAVALGLQMIADRHVVEDELRFLRQGLDEGIALLVGGSAVINYQEFLAETGAVATPDLDSMKQVLDQISG
jgi:DNA-binding transcriptional MerR regulator